jgi:hypothetical protein
VSIAVTIFWILARLLHRGEPAEARQVYRFCIAGLWLLIGWGLLLVGQAVAVILRG